MIEALVLVYMPAADMALAVASGAVIAGVILAALEIVFG